MMVPTIPAATVQITTGSNLWPYIKDPACPFLNTLFFMSTLVLIFYHTDYIQGFVTSLGVSNPFTFVLAFVGAQGLIEAVVCFILAGAISRALSAALHRI